MLDLEIDEDRNLTCLHLSLLTSRAVQLGQHGENLLFVPVRPDWRDSKSLLGYHNPLTGAYEWTPFLRFLTLAARNYREEPSKRLAWLVILDEMNLAHVEYYFADLLSVLESGRDAEGWTREPLRFTYPEDAELEGDAPPRELLLPPNLYVVGTVNVDETTHAFSPKVLDRAFTIEFTEVDFSAYPPEPAEDAGLSDGEKRAILSDFTQGGTFERVEKPAIAEYVEENPEVRERLRRLNELLAPHNFHFGYRVFDEIATFLANAEENGMFEGIPDPQPALDAAVLMKVLPKFHGARARLEPPLAALLAWCANPDAPATASVAGTVEKVATGHDLPTLLPLSGYRCPRTAERALRMLQTLHTDGFAAFG